MCEFESLLCLRLWNLSFGTAAVDYLPTFLLLSIYMREVHEFDSEFYPSAWKVHNAARPSEMSAHSAKERAERLWETYSSFVFAVSLRVFAQLCLSARIANLSVLLSIYDISFCNSSIWMEVEGKELVGTSAWNIGQISFYSQHYKQDRSWLKWRLYKHPDIFYLTKPR